MPRVPLRLAMGAASAFGFTLPGRNWVGRIQKLDGEYSRSRSEQFFALVPIGLCIVGIFIMLNGMFRERSIEAWVLYGIFVLSYSSLLYFSISRLGLKYTIHSEEVLAHNTWGKLMWRESLVGLERITCTRYRGATAMKLRWPNRARTMVLLDSLRRALDEGTNT